MNNQPISPETLERLIGFLMKRIEDTASELVALLKMLADKGIITSKEFSAESERQKTLFRNDLLTGMQKVLGEQSEAAWREFLERFEGKPQ